MNKKILGVGIAIFLMITGSYSFFCSVTEPGMMSDHESDIFWGSNPTTGEIIEKFFGTGSAYTRYWGSYAGCSIPTGNVVVVDSGIAFDGTTILDNHIYILQSGNHIVSAGKLIANSCVGIIGKGKVILWSTIQINGIFGVDLSSLLSRENIILDNLSIDGSSGHVGMNGAGISVASPVFPVPWGYVTINNIKSFNNAYGIYTTSIIYGIFNNLRLFNNNIGILFGPGLFSKILNSQIYNNDLGIEVNAGSSYNLFDNLLVYNNEAPIGGGIWHWNGSPYQSNSVISNSQIFNNSGLYGGMYVNNSNDIVLHNLSFYNNGNYGVQIDNSSGTINTLQIYNQTGVGNYGLGLGGAGLTYYGHNSFSGNTQNIVNVIDGVNFFQGNGGNSMGWTTGSFATGNTMSMNCSLVVQPQVSMISQLMSAIWYFTTVECDNVGPRSPDMIVPISCYKFGTGNKLQQQPVIYSGMTLISTGSYLSDKPIGFAQGMCNVEFSDCIENQFEGSGCNYCAPGLENVGCGLCCNPGGINSGGVCFYSQTLSCEFSFTGNNLFCTGGQCYTSGAEVQGYFSGSITSNYTMSGLQVSGIYNGITTQIIPVTILTGSQGAKTGDAIFSTGSLMCTGQDMIIFDTQSPTNPSCSFVGNYMPPTLAFTFGASNDGGGAGVANYYIEIETVTGVTMLQFSQSSTSTGIDVSTWPYGAYNYSIYACDYLGQCSSTCSNTFSVALTSALNGALQLTGSPQCNVGGNIFVNEMNVTATLTNNAFSMFTLTGNFLPALITGTFGPGTTGVALTLTAGEGVKTGFVTYSTGPSNVSYSSSLILDQSVPDLPVPSIVIPGCSISTPVSWSAVSDNGNPPVGGVYYIYEVFTGNTVHDFGVTNATGANVNLLNGDYQLRVKACDCLGNCTVYNTGSVFTKACNLLCDLEFTGSQIVQNGGNLYTSGLTNQSLYIFSTPASMWNISGNITTVLIDSGTVQTVNGLTLTGSSNGPKTVTGFFQTGSDSCEAVSTVIFDNISPSGLVCNSSGNFSSPSMNLSWSVASEGGIGNITYRYFVNGPSSYQTSGLTANNIQNISLVSAPIGAYNYTVFACDGLGNCSSCNSTFAVVGPPPPPPPPPSCSCGGTYPNCNSCGGGGGGGGGGITVDYCPNGDKSPSFFDGRCDLPVAPDKIFFEPYKEFVVGCSYSDYPYQTVQYADVVGHPYEKDIYAMTRLCITKGNLGHKGTYKGKSIFRINEYLSRGEFIKILMKLISIDKDKSWLGKGESDFTIPQKIYADERGWYTPYVEEFGKRLYTRLLDSRVYTDNISKVKKIFPTEPVKKGVVMSVMKATLEKEKRGKINQTEKELLQAQGFITRGEAVRLFSQIFGLQSIQAGMDGNNIQLINAIVTLLNSYTTKQQQKDKLVGLINVLNTISEEILRKKYSLDKKSLLSELGKLQQKVNQ